MKSVSSELAAKKVGVAMSAIRQWRENPVSFVREVFGVEPDAWQSEMLAAFPKHKRLVASACKGPGKTTLLAWLGWNFLATRPHPKVPCTSITGDNLRDGLWNEFAKWQKKSPLLERAFTWTKTRIFQKEHPETWWASARSWAKDADPTQQANTLAGLHEDYLLWLLDEVSEMPEGVVSAAEAALTGGIETRLAMTGNPTRTDGPLFRAVVTDSHLWHVTRISGDPDDPRRSPRIDIEEARKQIEKYGRDSYIVRVNILGLFPDRQADKLLDRGDVESAMRRAHPIGTSSEEARILGVDVARFGDDSSTFSPRQGLIAFKGREFHGLRSNEVGDRLIAAIQKWNADAAFVDGTGGYGAGVIDHCVSRNFGHVVHEVNFSWKASDEERFENKRSEMYWNAAQWVKGGGALPRDPLLAEELAAPIYWYDKKQRICLESKDDIKRRIGRSPDRADGFILTFASPVRRAHPTDQFEKRGNDYDPFARRPEMDAFAADHDYDPFERRP